MPLLRVDRLAVLYGATEVLRDLSFQVEPRQRLGIVGANGSGKSSLLKAISGEIIPTAGSLTLAPRARTAYLAQELEAGPHESVYEDALHSRPDIMGLRTRLAELETAMAGGSGAELTVLVENYGDVQHEYERLDGYAYDNRVAEVLHGVGLTEADQALPPSALSGGQRRRLALARLLLQDADLLLLDEPTNHLDLEAIEWLEEFLRLSRAGMLIVSHDRRFLEHTADDILELQAGSGEWYPGNYRQYLRLRRERRAVRQKEYDAQQDYIARTEEFIRRYKAGQRAREARGRQTKLDRLDRVTPPSDDQQIRIRLRASSTSDLIFQSDGLTLTYQPGGGSGWGLMMPAFTINAGERVAIVGPNGSGKTSLLKALLGELRPLKGRVKTGPRVTMRYYDQHLADLDPNKTVLTELQDAFGLPEETLRTFLGRLLFRGEDAFKVIRSLSGGEKSRVALAKLMLDDAGLLLLDEPTNHLDIPAQEMLEEALQDFEGTIVFVSHDRYFIDAIATRLWVVDQGTVTTHLGNYTDLERSRQRAGRLLMAPEPEPTPRRERRREAGVAAGTVAPAAGVEQQIGELEAEIRRLEERLADHQTYDDPARVTQLAKAHEDASRRLRALYQEWEQAAGE
jgi:ATP-binding cassette, subfamily F, member 3